MPPSKCFWGFSAVLSIILVAIFSYLLATFEAIELDPVATNQDQIDLYNSAWEHVQHQYDEGFIDVEIERKVGPYDRNWAYHKYPDANGEDWHQRRVAGNNHVEDGFYWSGDVVEVVHQNRITVEQAFDEYLTWHENIPKELPEPVYNLDDEVNYSSPSGLIGGLATFGTTTLVSIWRLWKAWSHKEACADDINAIWDKKTLEVAGLLKLPDSGPSKLMEGLDNEIRDAQERTGQTPGEKHGIDQPREFAPGQKPNYEPSAPPCDGFQGFQPVSDEALPAYNENLPRRGSIPDTIGTIPEANFEGVSTELPKELQNYMAHHAKNNPGFVELVKYAYDNGCHTPEQMQRFFDGLPKLRK